jgi:hypothetical protein
MPAANPSAAAPVAAIATTAARRLPKRGVDRGARSLTRASSRDDRHHGAKYARFPRWNVNRTL